MVSYCFYICPHILIVFVLLNVPAATTTSSPLRIIKVIYLSCFLPPPAPSFPPPLPPPSTSSFLPPPLPPPPPPQGHRDNTNVTFVNCVPYPLSNQMHPKIHSVMIFLVYFLVPLAIISVYYYHIARTLIKSAHDMPGELSEHTKRQVSCERMDG